VYRRRSSGQWPTLALTDREDRFHRALEEGYIIIEGSGRMTVDEETREVRQWDAVPNRLGGRHGLYNHTQEELELLAVAVCAEKGQFDATDLGDDLSEG